MQRAEYWARLVQAFWPVTTQSSPRGTARVVSDARSLPEPGSEKPWHHCSRPDSSRGTISAASDGRAYVIIVGARTSTSNQIPGSARSRAAISSPSTARSTVGPPSPPTSAGQP